MFIVPAFCSQWNIVAFWEPNAMVKVSLNWPTVKCKASDDFTALIRVLPNTIDLYCRNLQNLDNCRQKTLMYRDETTQELSKFQKIGTEGYSERKRFSTPLTVCKIHTIFYGSCLLLYACSSDVRMTVVISAVWDRLSLSLCRWSRTWWYWSQTKFLSEFKLKNSETCKEFYLIEDK